MSSPELARRLWAALIEAEINTAIAIGFPYRSTDAMMPAEVVLARLHLPDELELELNKLVHGGMDVRATGEALRAWGQR